jgi:cytochrome P450
LLFTPDILLAEANLLLVAGYDTSSSTLSSFFFYITRNPRVYAKLCTEIRDAFSSTEEISHGPKLAGCNYLRACIDETLRISAPGPSEFEREIMKGGAHIDGDYYPEGTIVGTPSWALFRNEEFYGDPSTFRPERWMPSSHPDTLNDAEDVLRLKRGFHPFQKGAGMCLGMNFANMMLRMSIAKTLMRMDVRATPGDRLGEGRQELGWGQRDPKQYVLRDAFIAERDGPVVQFRLRA